MANIRIPFFPEKFYHVYNKAVGNESLFYEDKNYSYFLSKVDQYVCCIADIYAFCLMPNHYHLAVFTKSDSAVRKWWTEQENERKKDAEKAGEDYKNREFDYQKVVAHQFGTVQNSYTKSLNKVYERKGGLFSQSVNRKLISENKYLQQAINYIHRNPVHHGFCDDPGEWTYSSYNSFFSSKPTSVKRDDGLLIFRGKNEFVDFSKKTDVMGYAVEMDLFY